MHIKQMEVNIGRIDNTQYLIALGSTLQHLFCVVRKSGSQNTQGIITVLN